MAKKLSYIILVYMQNHLQKPTLDYVTEGSIFFFFGLQPTYLSNPRSGIPMPKPPCMIDLSQHADDVA